MHDRLTTPGVPPPMVTPKTSSPHNLTPGEFTRAFRDHPEALARIYARYEEAEIDYPDYWTPEGRRALRAFLGRELDLLDDAFDTPDRRVLRARMQRLHRQLSREFGLERCAS